ncbi:MAG TPA: PASTA domain-containing protein [Solirubrobacterales bacterium]
MALVAIWASAASAQVSVGQTVRPPFELLACSSPTAYEEVQVSVGDGSGYSMPVSGTLTSWSTNAGPGPGQSMGIKVYRPLDELRFQVVAEDGPRALTSGGRNSFPVEIPVQAGDILGIFVPANGNAECRFGQTGLGTDFYRYNPGSSPSGAVVEFSPGLFGTEERLNAEASLLPPPAVSSLSPSSGPIKGATVAIGGANFAVVKGVAFGGIPAKSFSVDSEGQITAVAPDSSTLSRVSVAVTTAAGTATSSQTFAYEGCKVPKLKGRKLRAAKNGIRKSRCKLGSVKKRGDATAKTGKVAKQSPKPGKVLLPGTKVKVTLAE